MTSLPKGKIVCPCCGELASRKRRSVLQRLISVIKPVKRYACFFCDWEGLVPTVVAPAVSTDQERPSPQAIRS